MTSITPCLTHLGQHIVVDLYGIAPTKLRDIEHIQVKMTEAALAAKVTIVQTDFRHNSSGGVSATLILSESHFVMHTIPEVGVAMLDLYTCGGHTFPEKAFEVLIEDLEPEHTAYCRYHRGFKDESINQVLPIELKLMENQGLRLEEKEPQHALV